jgi:hypothetical protein
VSGVVVAMVTAGTSIRAILLIYRALPDDGRPKTHIKFPFVSQMYNYAVEGISFN